MKQHWIKIFFLFIKLIFADAKCLTSTTISSYTGISIQTNQPAYESKTIPLVKEQITPDQTKDQQTNSYTDPNTNQITDPKTNDESKTISLVKEQITPDQTKNQQTDSSTESTAYANTDLTTVNESTTITSTIVPIPWTTTKYRQIQVTTISQNDPNQCSACIKIGTGFFNPPTTTLSQAIRCPRCWCGFTDPYSCDCNCSYQYGDTPHIILTWNRWQADLGNVL